MPLTRRAFLRRRMQGFRALVCAGAFVGLSSASLSARAIVIATSSRDSARVAQTHMVWLAEPGRTVVTFEVRPSNEPSSWAVLVPVAGKILPETLREVDGALLRRLDAMAQPAFDELWELDPCELHPEHQAGPAPSASASASASPAEDAPGAMRVGAYEVDVLASATSDALGAWLKAHKLAVDKAGQAALAAAAADGASFLIARAAAKPANGAWPPLQFAVDQKAPTLLERGFAASADAPQMLTLDILAPQRRMEPEARAQIAFPTNLDVLPAASASKPAFLSALWDWTHERAPATWITSYAWPASACDGCPEGTTLGAADLDALGAGALPSAASGAQGEVVIDVEEALSKAPDGPPLLRSLLQSCYGKALGELRGLRGDAAIDVSTGPDGKATSATIRTASAEALGTCAAEAARAAPFDGKSAKGQIKVRFAPVSGAWVSGIVLTRLHARFTGAPSGDAPSKVSFRAGAAIEGGREEGPAGTAEQRVYLADHTNNLRPRYVVRHPWTGAISCDAPKRGVWGPPPQGAPSSVPSSKPTPRDAPTASAALPKTEVKLLEYLPGPAPDLAAFAIRFDPPAAAPDPAPVLSATAPASAASSAGLPAAPTPPTPPASDGCSCRISAEESGQIRGGSPEGLRAPSSGAWLALLGAVTWLLRRRRQ